MTPQSLPVSAADRFSRGGALLVALVGSVVLVGWIFDIPLLKSVASGLATMKANTAAGLVAAGVALWSLHRSPSASQRLAQALAFAVVALGAMTLTEDLFSIDLGIDQLLLRELSQAAAAAHPGRMAPGTAVSFVLVGFTLLALKERQAPRRIAWTQWLAFLPLFISTVAIVGYVYDVSSLYKVGAFSSMAIHTALSFFVLSLCLLAADPQRGIAHVAISDTDGGVVARRLLPTIPFLLFALGWACLAGEERQLYDSRFGAALMVVVSMTVCVLAVGSTSVALHSVDTQRRDAEGKIRELNAGLEQRVHERTVELQASLAQVKQLGGLLPICAWCKKIRDDLNYWQSVESYVSARTDATFSHGICPDCSAKFTAEEIAVA